ncbi:MAG TPA: hypothetical protein VGE59_05125 [Patescibacteria group bacterium]
MQRGAYQDTFRSPRDLVHALMGLGVDFYVVVSGGGSVSLLQHDDPIAAVTQQLAEYSRRLPRSCHFEARSTSVYFRSFDCTIEIRREPEGPLVLRVRRFGADGRVNPRFAPVGWQFVPEA